MLEPRGWSDRNAQRVYPFSDECTLLDDTETVSLPLDFITDLVVSAPSTTLRPVFLNKLTISCSIIALSISDATQKTLCYGTFNAATFTEGASHALTGTENAGGSITFGGGFQKMLAYSGQTLTFNAQATKVLPANVNLIEVGGVLSLQGLQGDVKLRAGTGVCMRYEYLENAIYIGLQQPDLFIPDCYRQYPCNENTCNATILRTINGIGPDSNGNFTITGRNIVQISNNGSTVMVYSSIIEPADLCEYYVKGPTGDPGPTGPRGTQGVTGVLLCSSCPDTCPGYFAGDCCEDCASSTEAGICEEITDLTEQQIKQRYEQGV